MSAAIMAAAAAIREENRVLGAFRVAGATAPDRAQPLTQLGVASSPAVTQLVAARILVEQRPDRWYLDERAVVAYRAPERQRVLMAAGLAAVTLLGGLATALLLALRRR